MSKWHYPKYINKTVVAGILPSIRLDVDDLRPGDRVFFCELCKNKKKREFWVLEGVIDSWNPQFREYNVKFKIKEKNCENWWHKVLFSNEIGDTPEKAVNNMFRLPWEYYK